MMAGPVAEAPERHLKPVTGAIRALYAWREGPPHESWKVVEEGARRGLGTVSVRNELAHGAFAQDLAFLEHEPGWVAEHAGRHERGRMADRSKKTVR